MDENELRRLLRSDRGKAFRGWRCPDDNEVIRYFGAQLQSHAKQRFESHVASCQSCRDLIGFLAASEHWPEAEPVPPDLLVRARSLADSESFTVWHWRWPIATAAAAIVILIAAFVVMRSRIQETTAPNNGPLIAQQRPTEAIQPSESPPQLLTVAPTPIPKRTLPSGDSRPLVRGPADSNKPTIVFPREGAVVKRQQLQFRWDAVPNAVFYQFKLVKEDGGLVFQDSNLQDVQLRVPEGVSLVPDKKYYVSVTAHTREGRSERSEPVGFRVVK